jgi:hypothetical protein
MARVEFNYTGRVQLLHTEVDSSFRLDGEDQILSLKWSLDHYSFAESSRVIVEVGSAGTFELRRHDLGAIGDGRRALVVRFPRLRNPELIRLTLKVVDVSSGLPMIRGVLDGIYPLDESDNSKSKSILPIVRDDELGVPWQLRFDEIPMLYLTGRRDLFVYLKENSREFNPTVLSEVVRQVFEWLALGDHDFDNVILSQWVDFFESLGSEPGYLEKTRAHGDEDVIHEVVGWSTKLSEEFARRFGFVDSLAGETSDGGAT